MAYLGTPEIRELLQHARPPATPCSSLPGRTTGITAADGRFRCTLPLTPSTRRAGAYARAALRRAGIPPPARQAPPTQQPAPPPTDPAS